MMSAVAAIVSHQASGFIVSLHSPLLYSLLLLPSPPPDSPQNWGMEEKELIFVISFSNLKVQLEK